MRLSGSQWYQHDTPGQLTTAISSCLPIIEEVERSLWAAAAFRNDRLSFLQLEELRPVHRARSSQTRQLVPIRVVAFDQDKGRRSVSAAVTPNSTDHFENRRVLHDIAFPLPLHFGFSD